MTQPFPYRFIAIEGNIGTGKTTLCHLLQQELGCDLILEQFTDNPFLPYFYKHPERYAFPVELFFMTERHKQLQEHFSKPDIFRQVTVADYFFIKTRLFARNNLNDTEYKLFLRLFDALHAGFPKPDLLVFLHRPIDVIQQQIRKRGREMEAEMSETYLENIKKAYFSYLSQEKELPILLLDLGDIDYVADPTHLAQIKELLTHAYPKGITQLSLGGIGRNNSIAL